MRRLALVALLVFPAAVPCRAQSPDAAELLEAAGARAADSPRIAESLLMQLAEAPDATDDQRVRGARLAMRQLPAASGNSAASALVLATLRHTRSQPDAWQLAFRVRDRVMDGLDIVNGEPFLRALIELYPDQLRFRHYLADLYFDAGRPEEADALCEEILRRVPDDTQARRIQAYVRELEGRTDEALDLYAQIHEIGGELEPLVYRVRILIDPVMDYDGAQEALDAALGVVDAAPAGPARNAARADLEYEQTRLDDERRRRDELLDVAARQDRIVLGVLAGWLVVLGGGLVWLRRRRLV